MWQWAGNPLAESLKELLTVPEMDWVYVQV